MSDTKKDIIVESLLNRGDDLPYGYFHPGTEGKLTWNCGYDAEGKITSVFCYDDLSGKDKKCQFLDTMTEAKYIRDELVKDGWKKIIPPEVTFTFPGESEPRKMTRKEKRFLKKKIEGMKNKNPFQE
jgi:hypothetical protein